MQEIGLLICVWENKYADKTVDFAICVDKTGKRYNIQLDNIIFFCDFGIYVYNIIIFPTANLRRYFLVAFSICSIQHEIVR